MLNTSYGAATPPPISLTSSGRLSRRSSMENTSGTAGMRSPRGHPNVPPSYSSSSSSSLSFARYWLGGFNASDSVYLKPAVAADGSQNAPTYVDGSAASTGNWTPETRVHVEQK